MCRRRMTPMPDSRGPGSRAVVETRMSPFIETWSRVAYKGGVGAERWARVEAARSQVDSKSRSLRSNGPRSPDSGAFRSPAAPVPPKDSAIFRRGCVGMDRKLRSCENFSSPPFSHWPPPRFWRNRRGCRAEKPMWFPCRLARGAWRCLHKCVEKHPYQRGCRQIRACGVFTRCVSSISITRDETHDADREPVSHRQQLIPGARARSLL